MGAEGAASGLEEVLGIYGYGERDKCRWRKHINVLSEQTAEDNNHCSRRRERRKSHIRAGEQEQTDCIVVRRKERKLSKDCKGVL